MTRNIPFCDAQLMFYISDWKKYLPRHLMKDPPPPNEMLNSHRRLKILFGKPEVTHSHSFVTR